MSTVLFDFFNTEEITCGYTTDHDGLWRFCCKDDLSHYEAFSAQFNLTPENLVRVHQKHTDRVIVIDHKDGGRGVTFGEPEDFNDGMVTNVAGLMPCVVTADCAPVFLYDTETKAIGLVHSGRAGTINEISSKAVEKMMETFGSDPKNVKSIIGPYISQKHHEVEEKDILGFYDQFSDAECSFFLTNKGIKYYVDMGKAITISLLRVGLKLENIHDCNICTFENKELFSWRRDHDPDKRILSFIFLNAHN